MASEPLPSDFLPFGHVVGRVIRAVGDTDADPDSDPEAIPVTGAGLVRFTPLDATRVVISTSPDTWVAQETIVADLDSDGMLSVSGSPGVALWPGAWKVSPGSASAFSFPAFTIEVTAAHTADSPLDLWTAAPYSPPSGTTVTTLVVPSGQQPGQTLGWDGTQLAWVTPTITPTATTLATESNATATMSGSWPNLTLALGLPRGADGQPSTYQIVGTGRPDVAASMTADVQAQVAAAPIGATFTSTDGASVGAWQWMRQPTGWTVSFGDTKPVYESGSAINGWTADSLGLRRCGNTVEFEFKALDPSAATSDGFYELPDGFKPVFSYIGWSLIRPSRDLYGTANIAFVIANRLVRMLGPGIVGSTSVISHDMNNQAEWTTTDPWPTTLPGTPA
jgi:hypothetical protein